MANNEGLLTIAHDFKHVDRVRNRALLIASSEGVADLEKVELTALFHDIGLPFIDENGDRRKHGEVGAEMAATFLKKESPYGSEQIAAIADPIKYHSFPPPVVAEHLKFLGERGKLLEILRDADNLDALGATGLMRAFTSKYFLPDYDPDDIRGPAWGLSTEELTDEIKDESYSVRYIIDQVNQQIRYYDSLHTGTARQIAGPLVRFMKVFVLQLEVEIKPIYRKEEL
jgi:uncharacterized protein